MLPLGLQQYLKAADESSQPTQQQEQEPLRRTLITFQEFMQQQALLAMAPRTPPNPPPFPPAPPPPAPPYPPFPPAAPPSPPPLPPGPPPRPPWPFGRAPFTPPSPPPQLQLKTLTLLVSSGWFYNPNMDCGQMIFDQKKGPQSVFVTVVAAAMQEMGIAEDLQLEVSKEGGRRGGGKEERGAWGLGECRGRARKQGLQAKATAPAHHPPFGRALFLLPPPLFPPPTHTHFSLLLPPPTKTLNSSTASKKSPGRATRSSPTCSSRRRPRSIPL
jgi:hypothetical protein